MADDAENPETPAEEPAATPEPEAAAPAPEQPEAEAAADAEEAPEAAPTGSAPQQDEAPATPPPAGTPAIPGADLEVDIVLDDDQRRSGGDDEFGYYDGGSDDASTGEGGEDADTDADLPIVDVTIDLSPQARYTATGKRKSAVARVILKPGSGSYVINGKGLEEYFPRDALLRTIRQALEVVGYHEQIDVVARIHGGGVSAQAGALRHGISRALIEAQPGLRGELKKRGFLTRDSRVKERKKAGLKKARKRPQFSKR